MNKKTCFKVINLFIISAFILTAGFGCKLINQETQKAIKPITLTYWRVYDDEDAFAGIINQYRVAHPNIQIDYRKFRAEEYESELLNALAEDQGPDLFSVHVGWLKKYQSKISPMPEQITMAYQTVKGSIKKETVIELKTFATPSLREIKDTFADAVAKDAIIDNKVYGLPLSLDNLVMFYNKDILNQADISQVPDNWSDFQTAVEKITKIDSDNNIILAGAALGTGKNVDKSFDILSVLMMQNGAVMTGANGAPTFFSGNAADNQNKGQIALQFYTDFANPLKTVYSWNTKMPYSFEAFLSGKVGFTFGYNYQLPIIRSQAPKLNFAVAPLPQILGNDKKNYASYFLETVSNKSAHPNEAWDFLLFMNKKDSQGNFPVKLFVNQTKRPTAIRELISGQLENEDLHAPASQTLTAGDWYRGYNYTEAQNIFSEMIDNYLNAVDERSAKNVISVAMEKLIQTMNSK